MNGSKKKIIIGMLLIVFGFPLIIPAIVGIFMVQKAVKAQGVWNSSTLQIESHQVAEKRKRILNISHPDKYLISEDHASFSGSSCCPLCSLYNHRIFSISGKDKRFPSLASLPDEIHDGKCDVCQCSYSLGVWFEGTSTPDIVTAIRKSNAPLKDRRTPEQIEAFEKDQAKRARRLAKQQAQNK